MFFYRQIFFREVKEINETTNLEGRIFYKMFLYYYPTEAIHQRIEVWI